MIRPAHTLVLDRLADGSGAVPGPGVRRARTKANSPKAPEIQTSPPPAAVPAWARASGRAGEPLFFAGASLALLDAALRRDPPAAGALRSRLALQSAAASAIILRLNADAAALRDLRFAVGDARGPAATLLSLWRDGSGRPPSLDPTRIFDAAARLDLAVDPNRLAASLKACAGEGDPVSAAAKAAAMAFSAVPDAPPAPSEIFALWVFDITLAIRLRWPRPVPLIAVKILDPTLRPSGAGRRPRPGEPAWPNAAAAATALAAASALDLAADVSRRSKTLIAVAPKLRSKPAAKIVDLLLAEDCVSPAEAARHAPMTGRAARRLFDRLVLLGAAREFSGRPTFRSRAGGGKVIGVIMRNSWRWNGPTTRAMNCTSSKPCASARSCWPKRATRFSCCPAAWRPGSRRRRGRAGDREGLDPIMRWRAVRMSATNCRGRARGAGGR